MYKYLGNEIKFKSVEKLAKILNLEREFWNIIKDFSDNQINLNDEVIHKRIINKLLEQSNKEWICHFDSDKNCYVAYELRCEKYSFINSKSI